MNTASSPHHEHDPIHDAWYRFEHETIAESACILLGFGLLLAGLIGAVAPGFAGMHMSMLHVVVFAVFGISSICVGLFAGEFASEACCITVAVVAGFTGLMGFTFGTGEQHTLASVSHHGLDTRLLKAVPDYLELATPDHIFHLGVSLAYLLAAVAPANLPSGRRKFHRRDPHLQ